MTTDLDFSLDRPVYGKGLLGTSGQLARASWLAQHVSDDDIYFMQDGEFSRLLLKEVLSSFLMGQYISAIVLGFSLIERTFAGRLFFVGEKIASTKKGEELLKKAKDRGWLSEGELKILDELRKLRNPIIHFRSPLSSWAKQNETLHGERLEEYAKKIIETMIHVLLKTAL